MIPISTSLPGTMDRLRMEVRSFLSAEAAAGTFESHIDSWFGSFDADFSKKLGAQGWLGMTWPKKYRGAGTVRPGALRSNRGIACSWCASCGALDRGTSDRTHFVALR